MLLTEQNTTTVERKIRRVAAIQFRGIYAPRDMSTFFEHGQWWLEHRPTGAQWSVCDCEPGLFCFEQVTIGEEA